MPLYRLYLFYFSCVQDPEGKVDGPFIIGASSQKQIQILKSLRVISNALLHIEGPHRLWLQKLPVFYYSLRLAFSDAQEILEVDSEDDGKSILLPQ